MRRETQPQAVERDGAAPAAEEAEEPEQEPAAV
jgi:hypothetical protein